MKLVKSLVPQAVAAAALSGAVALAVAAPASARSIAATAAAGSSRPTILTGEKSVGLGQAECSSWIDTYCYYAFINDTPYTMTLTQDMSWYGDHNADGFSGPPVDTLLPGQKEVFGFYEDHHEWMQAAISYIFHDVDGQKHEADYNIDSNGNPSATSNDFNADDQEFESTGTFYMRMDPDGWPNDIDAVLSHPAIVTYDAKTDPDQVASIMAKYWADGKDKDFTLLSGPTYSQSTPTRASGVVENTSNEPATLSLSGTDTHEESTSIGASLTWSTELGIFGLVNQKVSATLSGGHQWSTTDKRTDTESDTVPPGDVGCLFDSASMATVTGDFTLTTPEGITYHLNNVTVTDPAQAVNGPAVEFRPGRGKIGHPCEVVTLDSARDVGKQATMATLRGTTHKRRRHPKPQHHKGAPRVMPGAVTRADAPLTSGSPLVIDASKDPQAAGDAMAHWNDPGTTNKAFALTSNPIYGPTPMTSSNAYCLPPDYTNPEQKEFAVEHDYSSQWSISGTLSAETKLGIIGFANASLQVSVTAGHEWTTEHDENEQVTANIDPGYTDWIQMYAGEATITGDYSFTWNGTDYQVNNVTITEPANSSPDQPQGPYTSTVFTVVAQKVAKC